MRIFLLCFAILFSATGCAVDDPQPEVIREPVFTGEDIRYTTDVFRHLNFDGASPVATYRRSLSNESATNFQILVEAGGLVRGTPIPEFIEAELSTKIQTALSEQNIGSEKREFELPLTADAGTGLEHVLTFKETYLVGTIDVEFTDGIAKIHVEQLIKIELSGRTSTMIDPQEANEPSQEEKPEQESTAVAAPETHPTSEENSFSEPPAETTIDTPSASLLSQTVENIGTGVFTQAAYSDGMAEISYNDINAQYSNIQTINPQTSDTGCGIARYDVSELWFAGAAGSSLLINGEQVGQLSFGNGPHGHMISIDIFFGDEICIDPIPPGGYGMVLGPDVYFHYDSYCYRGFCP
jgi:hypothetical protein